MKKILCPTDFSGAANDAIAYAAKLSKAIGSSLTLLHVKSIFDFSLPEVIKAKGRSVDEVASLLEAQGREVSKTFKISCDAKVVSKLSRLSSVIKDEAGNFDLIVMGSNGPEDLYQLFSGSNTYNAIVNSETPMLVVPEGYIYSEIKKMVYAYDYLTERNLPLARLAPFVRALNCEVTVLQVMEEAYSQDAEEDLKELQFIIRSKYGNELNYEYETIRSSDIPSSINSYIQRSQPDALVLCSVHRGMIENIFHKSVIKHISAVSAYPVYVFHE